MDPITVPCPSLHIAAATHQMQACRVEGLIFLNGFSSSRSRPLRSEQGRQLSPCDLDLPLGTALYTSPASHLVGCTVQGQGGESRLGLLLVSTKGPGGWGFSRFRYQPVSLPALPLVCPGHALCLSFPCSIMTDKEEQAAKVLKGGQRRWGGQRTPTTGTKTDR